MKKKIALFLTFCVIVAAFSLCVTAEEYEAYQGNAFVKGEILVTTNNERIF